MPLSAGTRLGPYEILAPIGATTNNHYWDVAADGKRFLINTVVGDSTAAPITVVLNWEAGLKK
jgi:hypothetical protein